MTSSTRSRSGPTGSVWELAAFLLPFLIQIAVIPGWALGRLVAEAPVHLPELLGAGWPLLLVPAFAVACVVYWRREPRDPIRLNLFMGAATGALCITLFFVVVLME